MKMPPMRIYKDLLQCILLVQLQESIKEIINVSIYNIAYINVIKNYQLLTVLYFQSFFIKLIFYVHIILFKNGKLVYEYIRLC